jgi:hypothetical protein
MVGEEWLMVTVAEIYKAQLDSIFERHAKKKD